MLETVLQSIQYFGLILLILIYVLKLKYDKRIIFVISFIITFVLVKFQLVPIYSFNLEEYSEVVYPQDSVEHYVVTYSKYIALVIFIILILFAYLRIKKRSKK